MLYGIEPLHFPVYDAYIEEKQCDIIMFVFSGFVIDKHPNKAALSDHVEAGDLVVIPRTWLTQQQYHRYFRLIGTGVKRADPSGDVDQLMDRQARQPPISSDQNGRTQRQFICVFCTRNSHICDPLRACFPPQRAG